MKKEKKPVPKVHDNVNFLKSLAPPLMAVALILSPMAHTQGNHHTLVKFNFTFFQYSIVYLFSSYNPNNEINDSSKSHILKTKVHKKV